VSPGAEGYFAFHDAICFGRRRGRPAVANPGEVLPDVSADAGADRGGIRLPFDLTEIVTNLQRERYCQPSNGHAADPSAEAAIRSAYYFLRPILPVPVRKHLQRVRLRGWDRIPFPRWPVDFSVDILMRNSMELALRSAGVDKLPFIWFWPEGARGCGILTHDVEAISGREFCGRLMDLDDAVGLKASFQVVPEKRYADSHHLCEEVRRRGFEVNVHDLNHDGHLFHSKEEFLERAVRINQFRQAFQSRGFRAAAMYRRQDWLRALEFSYDMSVPNVAHLEPQRGGCCTIMPYFIDDMVELPLTTIQDYSLFQILGDYSTKVWKKQIELILERNGLVTVLTHPDYLIEKRARAVYVELLDYLRDLRDRRYVWFPLPGDVERWWRSRNQMRLVRRARKWEIEGPDSDRARIAFATMSDNRLVYEWSTDCISVH
jgi:hypothetical protein